MTIQQMSSEDNRDLALVLSVLARSFVFTSYQLNQSVVFYKLKGCETVSKGI